MRDGNEVGFCSCRAAWLDLAEEQLSGRLHHSYLTVAISCKLGFILAAGVYFVTFGYEGPRWVVVRVADLGPWLHPMCP